MARIFITGSADGLGHLTAKELVAQGHNVVLHARNAERGKEVLNKIPGAEAVLTADLSNMEETKGLAAKVNALGRFDAVIHNAGVYSQHSRSQTKKEFHETLFMVNTMAPYILTALINKPKRLIYLTSGMHLQGDPSLTGLKFAAGNYSSLTYSDTKLHDVILCMAVARLWSEVFSNTVNPGWVPTKMGGANAPDNLEKGFQTQAWLAVSNDKEALVRGKYFFHKKIEECLPQAHEHAVQETLLNQCERISGIVFPRA